ncbi:uncharacterized protein LOC135322184 [Camelus dromedarius]|uniref:uncharacterized protein LOC135322184 n=1 Tax=Camelus dromedarius TaxID=9838 RepID=UPI00311A5647
MRGCPWGGNDLARVPAFSLATCQGISDGYLTHPDCCQPRLFTLEQTQAADPDPLYWSLENATTSQASRAYNLSCFVGIRALRGVEGTGCMVGLVEVALWKRKRVQKGTPEDWLTVRDISCLKGTQKTTAEDEEKNQHSGLRQLASVFSSPLDQGPAGRRGSLGPRRQRHTCGGSDLSGYLRRRPPAGLGVPHLPTPTTEVRRKGPRLGNPTLAAGAALQPPESWDSGSICRQPPRSLSSAPERRPLERRRHLVDAGRPRGNPEVGWERGQSRAEMQPGLPTWAVFQHAAHPGRKSRLGSRDHLHSLKGTGT